MASKLWGKFELLCCVLDVHSHSIPERGRLHIENLAQSEIEKLEAAGFVLDKTAEGVNIDTGIGTSRIYAREDDVFYVTNYDRLESDFAVLDCKSYYKSDLKRFIDVSQQIKSYGELDNHIAFLELKNTLCKSYGVNEAEPLISYHDDVERRMILISGVKGILNIGYTLPSSKIPGEYNLSVEVRRLQRSLEAKGWPELFKQELYPTLKEVEEKKRLERFALDLNRLISNTDGSYELYMSNFSMESLRDKIRQEKVRYYNATREVLSKIYAQITSTTIAISASALATASVSAIVVLIFILVAYAAYAIFIVLLLRYLKTELTSLRSEFEEEKAELMRSSKLPAAQIQNETAAIINRFTITSKIIWAFGATFILLTLVFVLLVVWKINTAVPANPNNIQQKNSKTFKKEYKQLLKPQDSLKRH